eukprot:353830_1
MAQEMFTQMKQLKAHNEAMGYHGYSGYLQKHDSSINMINTPTTDINTPITDFETEAENNIIRNPFDRNINHMKILAESTEDYTDKELIFKRAKIQENKSSIILSETQALKHKLELVTSSINKIRHDLQQTEQKENDKKQLNNLIMYFQNQLTEIQDQIEDAENDIESNIDVKFIKYMDEIKMNKNKIKTLKKQKKDKEKQQQINKDKEQQRVIELQRLQIEQLISTQKSQSSSPGPRYDKISKHERNTQSQYFPLDSIAKPISPNQLSINNKNRRRKNSRTQSIKSRGRKHSIQSGNSMPRIHDDDDINYNGNIYPNINNINMQISGNICIESEDDDEVDNEMNIQYINNNSIPIPGVVMNNNTHTNTNTNTNNTRRLMHPNNGSYRLNNSSYQLNNNSSYRLNSQSPNYIEGAYQSMGNIITQSQREQPILTDNAVKIIGGVVIVLAGLYVISKYLNRNQRSIHTPPPNIRRGARIKYG